MYGACRWVRAGGVKAVPVRIAIVGHAVAAEDHAGGMAHRASRICQQDGHHALDEVRSDDVVAGFRHHIVRVAIPEGALEVGNGTAVASVVLDADRRMALAILL